MAETNPSAFVPSADPKVTSTVDPSYQPFLDQKPPSTSSSSEPPSLSSTSPSSETTAHTESENPLSTTVNPSADPNQPPKDFVKVFPSHLPTPPFIDVQGIPNFRDVGGYSCPAPPGSPPDKKYMVKPGFLFRCAHPTELTAKGGETMSSKLGIKEMFDLRSEPEIRKIALSLSLNSKQEAAASLMTNKEDRIQEKTPVQILPDGSLSVRGVTRQFVPVYNAVDYSPEALAKKLAWYTTANEPDKNYSEGMINAYRDIALQGAGIPTGHWSGSSTSTTNTDTDDPPLGAYRIIFRHILDNPSSPAVFHCTAGKDRTGVLAAMILLLCGVERETVVWEYAITEPGLGSWRDLFIERITKGGMEGATSEKDKNNNSDAVGEPEKRKGVSRAAAIRICGSRSQNLRAWMDIVLDGEFGGVEKYLVEKCGFTTQEVEGIRRNLVIEVPSSSGNGLVEPVEIQGWSLDGGMEKDREFLE